MFRLVKLFSFSSLSEVYKFVACGSREDRLGRSNLDLPIFFSKVSAQLPSNKPNHDRRHRLEVLRQNDFVRIIERRLKYTIIKILLVEYLSKGCRLAQNYFLSLPLSFLSMYQLLSTYNSFSKYDQNHREIKLFHKIGFSSPNCAYLCMSSKKNLNIKFRTFPKKIFERNNSYWISKNL